MPKNRGNDTGAGLTPFRRTTFLRTKPCFSPIICGWTQFSNLLDGLKGAENLRFQGPRQIQIADNLGRSGVPKEMHNKTLLVRKVCWNKLLLSGTNQECRQKRLNGLFWSVIIKFSNNNVSYLYTFYFKRLRRQPQSSCREHCMTASQPRDRTKLSPHSMWRKVFHYKIYDLLLK